MANDFGFKVSLPGQDAETAGSSKFSVHSTYPPLKSKANMTSPHDATVDIQFTSAVTQATNLTVYRIPHGYDYIPANLTNLVLDGDGISNLRVGLGGLSIGAFFYIDAYCTATEYVIVVYDDNFVINNTYRLRASYYIFAEEGT